MKFMLKLKTHKAIDYVYFGEEVTGVRIGEDELLIFVKNNDICDETINFPYWEYENIEIEHEPGTHYFSFVPEMHSDLKKAFKQFKEEINESVD